MIKGTHVPTGLSSDTVTACTRTLRWEWALVMKPKNAQKCLCGLHVRTHACNFLNIYYHGFAITFLALSTPCVSTNNILHHSIMPALVIFLSYVSMTDKSVIRG